MGEKSGGRQRSLSQEAVVNTSLALGDYPLQKRPDKRTVKTPAMPA